MPGIIDAHSHAALENGINEGSESVTPEVQVQLKNDDPVIYRALAGGVTAANLLHGSANTIGGQSRVIKMRWGMPVDSMYFKGAFRIVKFALGENVTRASSTAPADERRFPMTRMGVDFTLSLLVHEGEGVRQGVDGLPRGGEDESRTRSRRGATCGSKRSSTFCTAISRCTRTAIAPTRSSC